MDESSFGKACTRKREEEGGIENPLHGTWVTDFMMDKIRENSFWESTLVTHKSHGKKETNGDGSSRNNADGKLA